MDSTYENNLANAVVESGGRVQRSGDGGGIDAIVTAAGRAIVWRQPGSPSDPETVMAERLVMIPVKAAAKLNAIEADATRSQAWKNDEREKATAAARAEYAAAKAQADALTSAFAAADVREATPPALAPTDAAGAILDSTIQSRVLGMTPPEQAALAKRMIAGELPRVVAALLRDAFGLPAGVLADAVPAAYVSAVAAADPHQARLRNQARARVDSLNAVVSQAADALPPLTQAQRLAASIATEMASRT